MIPFNYPVAPIERVHGPSGYADYESYRPWLRDEFFFRCAYCLRREPWGPRKGEFHIDHVRPQASNPDLALTYDNLVYSCCSCNLGKSDETIHDPLTTLILENVSVRVDGRIETHTKEASNVVEALHLNDESYVEFRGIFIDVVNLTRETEGFETLMSFPADLPDLTALEPPENNRSGGVDRSFNALEKAGNLPKLYTDCVRWPATEDLR